MSSSTDGSGPRPGGLVLRDASTDELLPAEIEALRSLFDAAWGATGGRFDDADWLHATGGTHVLASLDGRIVAHAAVARRPLEVDGHHLDAGYVEAVATEPEAWGRGHGTVVMARIDAHVLSGFDIGALSTGAHHFYERLGWERWSGPTFVRTAAGLERTPDDDGGLMILRTPRTPSLDLAGPIICDWRPGDAW